MPSVRLSLSPKLSPLLSPRPILLLPATAADTLVRAVELPSATLLQRRKLLRTLKHSLSLILRLVSQLFYLIHILLQDMPLTYHPTESESEAFCYRADGDCHKLKRAAEAVASIMAEEPAELLKRKVDILHIMPHQNGCYTPGGGCGTAKRDADNVKVVAKRAADILHIMPHENTCHTPGGGCGTGKRDVEGHEVIV